MYHSQFIKSRRALCAALLVASAVFPLYAKAQTNTLPTVEELEPSSLTTAPMSEFNLKVQNVPVSIVAYWLNASRQEVPAQLNGPLSSFSFLKTATRLPGNGNGPLNLRLPLGVESIYPIDEQNTLKVRATPGGFADLQALLPTLDVPIVQYEVEARFCKMNRLDLKGLGLTFPQRDESAYEFGSVTNTPNNLLARVGGLTDKKIKVLSAPRLLVIDGLEASIQQTVSIPLLMDEKQDVAKQPVPQSTKSLAAPVIATLDSPIGLRAAVVRRAENLITLALAPSFGARSLSLVTDIHEDTTLAVQMSPSQEKEQLIVFVTVRRVRRAGGEDGTQ